jgi:hypothetical protein
MGLVPGVRTAGASPAPRRIINGRTPRIDRLAAEVTEDPVSPADLTATIFHGLGVDRAQRHV